jgi:hypothetical protein
VKGGGIRQNKNAENRRMFSQQQQSKNKCGRRIVQVKIEKHERVVGGRGGN